MNRGKEKWMMGVMGAIFLLLVLSFSSFAAEGDTIDGAPYLREGAGARSLAMGGASAPATLMGELIVINLDILAWIVILHRDRNCPGAAMYA